MKRSANNCADAQLRCAPLGASYADGTEPAISRGEELLMKAIWIVAVCMYLVTGLAAAQGADSAASAPQTPVSASSPERSASNAPLTPVAVDQALRQDIATILATTAKIAKTQEDEGSLLLKVRDGFLTNALWELFGFKNTDKTLAGYAISLLGILGLILKAVWFVSKKGEPEPKWARALTYAYLLVAWYRSSRCSHSPEGWSLKSRLRVQR